MAEKTLTTPSVFQARFEKLRDRERKARAAAARIHREMVSVDKRLETQRLCVPGHAITMMSGRDPRVLGTVQRFLIGYVSCDTDRFALRGTPVEVPEPADTASIAGEVQHAE